VPRSVTTPPNGVPSDPKSISAFPDLTPAVDVSMPTWMKVEFVCWPPSSGLEVGGPKPPAAVIPMPVVPVTLPISPSVNEVAGAALVMLTPWVATVVPVRAAKVIGALLICGIARLVIVAITEPVTAGVWSGSGVFASPLIVPFES
jgi:hypothetical protein